MLLAVAQVPAGAAAGDRHPRGEREPGPLAARWRPILCRLRTGKRVTGSIRSLLWFLARARARPAKEATGVTDVVCEIRDQIAIVTLNRPARRNALSAVLLTGLRSVIAELDPDPAVRAVVLTGADPAFCAGLDLTELGQPGSPLSGVSSGPVLPGLSKPLIGAVNGVAVTGGLELALRCDFLVASERARFADTHARVGIMPGWGLTVELPEAVGLRRAREMSATGNFVGARTAMEWGLVNHVVPHDELLDFAVGLATDISSSDPASVQAIFATYRAGSQVTGAEARRIEAEANKRWHAAGIDGERVAERRAAVIERGRSQTAAR
jgi:enoyl-CoA hydratase